MLTVEPHSYALSLDAIIGHDVGFCSLPKA